MLHVHKMPEATTASTAEESGFPLTDSLLVVESYRDLSARHPSPLFRCRPLKERQHRLRVRRVQPPLFVHGVTPCPAGGLRASIRGHEPPPAGVSAPGCPGPCSPPPPGRPRGRSSSRA